MVRAAAVLRRRFLGTAQLRSIGHALRSLSPGPYAYCKHVQCHSSLACSYEMSTGRRMISTTAAAADDRELHFASAAAIADCDTTLQNPAAIVEEIFGQLDAQLAGCPDLLLFFNATSSRAPLDGKLLAKLLREHVVQHWSNSADMVILGMSWDCDGPGTGVVGGPPTPDGCREVQEIPAVTVLGAVLPDVRILPFTATPDHDGLPILHSGSWAELSTLPEMEAPHVLLFSGCVPQAQDDERPVADLKYSARHSLPHPILRYLDNVLPFSIKVGGLVPRGTMAFNATTTLGSQLSEDTGGLLTLDYDNGENIVSTQGIAGIVFEGNIEIDTLVCQGAVGFGPVYEITKCEGPNILEMDGHPAAGLIVDSLQDGRRRHVQKIFASETGQGARGGGGDMAAWRSPADDEGYGGEPVDTLRIVAGVALDGQATRGEVSLPLSVAANEQPDASDTNAKGTERIEEVVWLSSVRMSSEFVVRRIVQVDRESGAIQLDVAPELLRVGTRMQLHAYGRSAAIDDMEAQAGQLAEIHRANGVQPVGQLMVTCLGRGEQLYGEEGVETATLADAWWPNDVLIPTAGFFAGSEIGPVGYRSYTHSYVTSLALFRPRWKPKVK